MPPNPTPSPVLLIEDDSNDVLLTQRALAKAHLQNPLRVLRDGEEALAYLNGSPPFADRTQFPLPAVILLDLKLPRKPGADILAWLRHHPPLTHLPVVVLTSSQSLADVNHIYQLGADAFLVKPVTPDSWRQVVQALQLHCLIG